ncbi:hypothetical protein F5Y11DRAFT_358551 [Daldinia sp. FL1419]|nr:hypothetical protein F5Y11DRAFT_358551 [Daldinia sp. FL1419]
MSAMYRYPSRNPIAKHELGNNDFQKFLNTRDYETCINQLTADKNAFSKKWTWLKGILTPCFNVLQTFDRAISTCCQSNPEVACLVWGGIQVVLTIASKFSDCVRRISNMLQQISKSMPRFEDYSRFFPNNDRLHLRLVDIYEVFIIFLVRAFKFFKSRFLTVLVKVTWQSLDNVFAEAIENLKEGKEELESEARAANIQVGFDREEAAERRHQDVMAVLPVALKSARLVKPTVIIPYDRNPIFLGRQEELTRMRTYANEPSTPGKRPLRTIAIRGIGGMGKTQLALEFIFRERWQYRGVFWIRSEDATIQQQDFAHIAQTLNTEEAASMNLDKNVQAAKDWLSATEEPWLLVFDNVDDADSILDFWPHSGTGVIIVTTRDRDIADRLAELKIELEGFDAKEGATLLHQIDPRINTSDVARDISDELGGLPLALCQMGSYMRQTQCRPDDFLHTLRKQPERLYSDNNSTRSLQYSNTVAKCCDLSISLLPQEGVHLLGVIALFATDEVQEGLVTKGCLSVSRLRYLSDFIEWNNAIRMLTQHGLIGRFQVESGQMIRIHRVLKRHVLHLLDSQKLPLRGRAFQDASDLLNQMFPQRPPDGGTMSKSWSECELWLPHVLSLKEAYASFKKPTDEVPRSYLEILSNCSWYMWERNSRNALEFASDALDICNEAMEEDDPDPVRADILTILAALVMEDYHMKGQCADLFQRALEARQKYMAITPNLSRDDHRQLANAYNNTGVARLALEQYDDALPLLQKSLEVKQTLGDEKTLPYDFGISYYNICRVHMGKGLFSKALEYSEKAVELAERNNGADDYRVNQFRFTYADLLVACGRIDEGLEIHKKTLEIRVRIMGPDNNDCGVSHYGLSCVYQQLGLLDDALEHINLAINIFQGVAKAEDRVARSCFRKYLILTSLEDHEGATEALNKARNIRKTLISDTQTTNDTMEEYDSLVSYILR